MQTRHSQRGATLLELIAAIIIIIILATLAVPAYKQYLGRADRGNCASNLRNLYAGASGYYQDNGHWPQSVERSPSSPGYTTAWVGFLRPYGISHKNWICPSVQRNLGHPEYEKGKSIRIDYFAMPFDDKPQTPHKYPLQPWFSERGDVHGDGQLLILTNGQTYSLKEIAKLKGKIYAD